MSRFDTLVVTTSAHARRARLLVLAALAAQLMGCPSAPFTLTHLEVLDDAVLGVDDEHARARVVPATRAEAPIELDIGEGHASLHPRDTSEREVLLFTTGRPAEEDREGTLAELVRVSRQGALGWDGAAVPARTDRDGARPGRWVFADQYGSLQLDASGRYGMAVDPLGRLVVENRVELVDLDAAPSETNPVGLSLRSLGGETPSGFAVSPALDAPGVAGAPPARGLRVVALLAPGQLSLFDLDAPGVPPVTVPTDLLGGPTGPRPVEVAFVGARAVVRTQQGSQLLVVGLVARDASAGGQRFDVTLSTLQLGAPAQQLHLDDRASSPRLLALAGATLAIFDLDAGLERRVPLPSSYAQLAPFEGPAPGDPATRDRIVLFGVAASLTFVDLGDAPLDVREVETLSLDFVPTEAVADLDALVLTCFRPGIQYATEFAVDRSSALTPVALVDLRDRSATPIGTTALERSTLSTDHRTLWVADGGGYVSRFDIASLTQHEGWVGRDVEALLPLPGPGRFVLAFSDVRAGDFVVLDETTDVFEDFARQRSVF